MIFLTQVLGIGAAMGNTLGSTVNNISIKGQSFFCVRLNYLNFRKVLQQFRKACPTTQLFDPALSNVYDAWKNKYFNYMKFFSANAHIANEPWCGPKDPWNLHYDLRERWLKANPSDATQYPKVASGAFECVKSTLSANSLTPPKQLDKEWYFAPSAGCQLCKEVVRSFNIECGGFSDLPALPPTKGGFTVAKVVGKTQTLVPFPPPYDLKDLKKSSTQNLYKNIGFDINTKGENPPRWTLIRPVKGGEWTEGTAENVGEGGDWEEADAKDCSYSNNWNSGNWEEEGDYTTTSSTSPSGRDTIDNMQKSTKLYLSAITYAWTYMGGGRLTLNLTAGDKDAGKAIKLPKETSFTDSTNLYYILPTYCDTTSTFYPSRKKDGSGFIPSQNNIKDQDAYIPGPAIVQVVSGKKLEVVKNNKGDYLRGWGYIANPNFKYKLVEVGTMTVSPVQFYFADAAVSVGILPNYNTENYTLHQTPQDLFSRWPKNDDERQFWEVFIKIQNNSADFWNNAGVNQHLSQRLISYRKDSKFCFQQYDPTSGSPACPPSAEKISDNCYDNATGPNLPDCPCFSDQTVNSKHIIFQKNVWPSDNPYFNYRKSNNFKTAYTGTAIGPTQMPQPFWGTMRTSTTSVLGNLWYNPDSDNGKWVYAGFDSNTNQNNNTQVVDHHTVNGGH